MCSCLVGIFFFFQAEDGIRDLVRSRGLGDVYKRQEESMTVYFDLTDKNQKEVSGSIRCELSLSI